MEPEQDSLESRRTVWAALSELFLDTELQRVDFLRLALALKNSGYDVSEFEFILRHEVAPVLGGNLFAVAGVWDAFDLDAIERRYLAGKTSCSLGGRAALKVIREDWENLLKFME